MKLIINGGGIFGFQLKPEDTYDKIAYVIIRVMYLALWCWIGLHIIPLLFILGLDWIFSNTIHLHVPYNWYTWGGTVLFFAWVYHCDHNR